MVGPAAGFIDEDETDELYRQESDGLYEYFVQGIPGTFTENIDTFNDVVNGGKNTYFSITLDNDDEPSLEDRVVAASEDDANWIDGVLFVTLSTRPLSISVKMSVSRKQEENTIKISIFCPTPLVTS